MNGSPMGDMGEFDQDWSGFFGGTQIRGKLHGSLSRYYGFKADQWRTLLGKGASLKTLGETNLKEDVPEYGSVREDAEKFKTTPIYSRFLMFTKRVGETRHYRGIGKERTLARLGEKGFVGFGSREEGQRAIDRVLGIYAARKKQAGSRLRAPGRSATMLTSPGKSVTPGY